MDRPLIVSAPLVKPIIAGEKILTSRLRGLEQVNESPGFWELTQFKQLDTYCVAVFRNTGNASQLALDCPYGGLGSFLWVREGWYVSKGYDGRKPRELDKSGHILVGYIADGPRPGWAGKGRAAIHMPREFSRLKLVLTGLACERVQDISEVNAQKEGVQRLYFHNAELGDFPKDPANPTYYDGFRATWIGLNGRESWDRNPWVWRLFFNLITPSTCLQ
jgi:hypothetical protein